MNQDVYRSGPLVLLSLGLLGCPTQVGGPSPAEEFSCSPGWLDDDGTCVPESCGVGTWGELAVQAGAVFVNVESTTGGDGSAEAPLQSIQAGLDLAADRGGGLVAVAAGRYPETLAMGDEHDGVHLAGRCAELVVVDASVGDAETAGLEIAVGSGSAEVSGLTVTGAHYFGLAVSSGSSSLSGLVLEGNTTGGAAIFWRGIGTTTDTVLEGCVLTDNMGYGLLVNNSMARGTLRDCTIRDTRTYEDDTLGYGVKILAGATLRLEGCELVGNTEVGLQAIGAGTTVELVSSGVRGTLLNRDGLLGYGLEVSGGAAVTVEDSVITDNNTIGVVTAEADTVVTMRRSSIRRTQPDSTGEGGHGVEILYGASLLAEGSDFTSNTTAGVLTAYGGASVSLRECSIQDTEADVSGGFGYGIGAYHGAKVEAEACEVSSSTTTGIAAEGDGTSIRLEGSSVRDTRTRLGGDGGHGIEIRSGASLVARESVLERNRAVGMIVTGPRSQATLRDCSVRDTLPNDLGGGGYGIEVYDRAHLAAEACEIARNRGLGATAFDPGTLLELHGCLIADNHPLENNLGGFGVVAWNGAVMVLDGCTIRGNTQAGLGADGEGTAAVIHDTVISGTVKNIGEQGMTALGLYAQAGATVTANGLVVRDDEGLGLAVMSRGTQLSCSDCSLLDNQFAGASVVDAGSLQLIGSTVSGTTESANLGGGVGVYAAFQADPEPPALTLSDCTIEDNLIAGVHLSGAGHYRLAGNVISGTEGLPHGVTTRCGDGVFASGSLEPGAEGSVGLVLEDNLITANQGAGLFLDSGSALLEGNEWTDNHPDLLAQGDACATSVVGQPDAQDQDICPLWGRPTCELILRLELEIDEIAGTTSQGDLEPQPSPPFPASIPQAALLASPTE